MKKLLLSFLLITSTITYTVPSIEAGMEYQKNELFEEAIICYEAIVLADPDNINALFNLGYCYLALGYGEQALAAFTAVVTKCPTALPAWHNIGFTHKTIGNLDKAVEVYEYLIKAHPDYDPAQLGLGFSYITKGDFKRGWPQHERYLKQSGKNGDALRRLLETNTIAYKKILLRPEGDLGDTMLFVRYAERLKNMYADVIVACQKQLIPLLSRCPYIDELITCNSPLPLYDADATLMSMPAIFGDDETTAPCSIPYLFADPKLVDYWHEQLKEDTNFKVGICWQVSIKNDESRLPIARRGCPLEKFTRLQAIDGVSFYSLQKYDGVEELAALSSDFTVRVFENLDDQAGPFMDTAAIIKNLDLIITVDTSIVHLAGALGKKVWLLHPYATADWRWICHRTDSYWYPTVRIFKQQKPFDWDGVMKNVYDALQQLVAE